MKDNTTVAESGAPLGVDREVHSPRGFRYVAVCDVLGFSALTQSLDLAQLVNRFKGLLAMTQHVVHGFSNIFPSAGPVSDLVAATVFSDTILLYSIPLNPKETLFDVGTVSCFFDVVTQLLGASIVTDLPIRAGIAFGETYISRAEGVFLGTPIVWAYKTETEQDWVGGACHSSCERAPFFAERVCDDWHQAVPYEVPLRCGTRRLWALNWLYPTPVLAELEACRQYLHRRAVDMADDRRGKKYDAAAHFLTYLEACEPYRSRRQYFDEFRRRGSLADEKNNQPEV